MSVSEQEARIVTPPQFTQGLRWSIKSSFVSYIAGMPNGRMALSDGVVDTPQGFVFPVADASGFDTRTGTGTLIFTGDVRFSGHGGMLKVRFSAPRITVDTDGARLYIADISGQDLMLAHLGTPAPAAGGGLEIPTQLSEDAVSYFNDAYAAGTPLDPLVIRGV